jgi:hypothetical protein
MIRVVATGMSLMLAGALVATTPAVAAPHNVILFVADGLRNKIVRPDTAPTMAAIRDAGVSFPNSHSLFPTFTTANASAMATGHYLGDTGDFSNFIFTGYPVEVPGMGKTVTPFLENDPVLGDIDAHFGGNYLDEETIIRAAREKGMHTAAIGKLGPTLIFDHTERTGQLTVTLDDQTGTKDGVPLADWLKTGLAKVEMPPAPPKRDQPAGDMSKPGTLVANIGQQAWFADAAAKVVLPKFAADDKGFVLVFWSRDPDGTQHNQGDSLNRLTPGINGPTSLASIRNADDNLAELRKAVHDLGLDATTDIILTSDHGFSTISKESATSSSAKDHYADVPTGFIPTGFVSIDLAKGLGLPLFDPDRDEKKLGVGEHPRFANGLIGDDPRAPKIIVAGNGGSDLIYIPSKDQALAQKVVDILLAQDYVSGIFVDRALGQISGTLPLTSINLEGSAVTPMPAIAVNFTSFSTGCAEPQLCTVEVADTGLQQGQGMHGSFSRADTHNFMAAIGPSFKHGFVDPAPASNADLGRTIAQLLELKLETHGKLLGRPLLEAMTDGQVPAFSADVLVSKPAANGLVTKLRYQSVGDTLYFDAAGFANRTVGLEKD